MVGLDVADGPFQVGAAAQRPVNNEQVISVRVPGPEGEGEVYFGVGEPLLQGEG